jgi:hypothetical protein
MTKMKRMMKLTIRMMKESAVVGGEGRARQLQLRSVRVEALLKEMMAKQLVRPICAVSAAGPLVSTRLWRRGSRRCSRA